MILIAFKMSLLSVILSSLLSYYIQSSYGQLLQKLGTPEFQFPYLAAISIYFPCELTIKTNDKRVIKHVKRLKSIQLGAWIK